MYLSLCKAFLNREEQSATACSDGIGYDANQDSLTAKQGKTDSLAEGCFQGKLKDVRVYSRMLTQA